MGVLPLTYAEGQNAASLGLTGRETFSITGIAEGLAPGGRVRVWARPDQGAPVEFEAVARLNSPVELDYYRHGGILQRVLRHFLAE
jgi:aconitate hydratase